MEIHAVFEPTVQHPYGYVYVTHDVVNHKYYCGKHKSAVFDTEYYGSGTLLKKSLQQHPPSNFICVPIDWAETADELHQKEVQWIQHYNAVDDSQWYNLIEDSNRYVQNQFFNGIPSGFEKLSTLPLSKMAYRLVNYILSIMDYNNKFYYSCSEFSSKLKCHCSAVSAAIKELILIEFCVPVEEKLYLVNPEFGVRGSDSSTIQRCFDSLYQTHLKQKKLHQTNTAEKVKQTPTYEELKQLLTLSQKYGDSAKQKIMKYLMSLADNHHTVFKQVKDMVADLKISKVTIISFLQFLENTKLISRPERGVICLSQNFVQLFT